MSVSPFPVKPLHFLIIALLGLFVYVGVKIWDLNRFGHADLTNGEKQYQQHCLVCHGPTGHGDGPLSHKLAVSPDDLYAEVTNPFGLKSELVGSVMEGDNGEGGKMPAFRSVLTEADVNDVLEYIRYINQQSEVL